MLGTQITNPRNADSDSHAHFPKNHLKVAPPQHMTATRVATEKNRVCHRMSPSTLQDLRAISALVFTLDPSAPRSLGPFFHLLSPSILESATVPKHATHKRWRYGGAPYSGSNVGPFVIRETPPTRGGATVRHASALRLFAFRSFDFSTFPPKTTQNAKRPNTCPPQHLQTKKIACVTVCHLRLCRTYARSARWSSPRIPLPLDPSAPFFHLMSPWICTLLARENGRRGTRTWEGIPIVGRARRDSRTSGILPLYSSGVARRAAPMVRFWR